jgi:hypothetical protein
MKRGKVQVPGIAKIEKDNLGALRPSVPCHANDSPIVSTACKTGSAMSVCHHNTLKDYPVVLPTCNPIR